MMSDGKLAEQLLRQNDEVPARVPTIVDEVTRRERRRVRVWAVATGVLWVLAAAYLLGLLWFYVCFLHPVFHEYFTRADVTPEAMQPRMRVVFMLLKALLWWPGLLFLAAASTTLFTLASRRATLRQIQASLAEISEQVKSLTAKT
jgi:hypothetical protein